MKSKGIIKAVIVSVLVMFLSGVALAQDGDTSTPSADNMKLLMDKIKADKKFFVAANMKLTDSEAKAFWPVYDNYQKELIALNERAFKNIADYAANFDKMDDNAAKRIVKESLAVDSDRQKVRQSYLPKFAKVLPYKKVMRYYQLENKILAALTYEAAKQIPLVD